jgi:hypothetical protein
LGFAVAAGLHLREVEVYRVMRWPLSFLAAACILGCSNRNAINRQPQLATPNKSYYFEIDKAEKQRLLERVGQLHLGTTRKNVIDQLGPPTYDRAAVTKEGKPLGRTVVYYLKRWEEDLVNEKHDKLLTLQFDTNDRLTKIYKKDQP